MKRVDLDARERSEIELTVSGLSWRIRKTVTAVNQVFGPAYAKAGAAQQRLGEILKQVDSGAASEADVETELIEIDAAIAELDAAVFDCLEILLETNGYEFDRAWWEHATDRHDRMHAVAEAISKDVKPGGNKKKEAAG